VGVSAHRTYSADRIPKVVTVRRFAQHRPQLRQSDSLTEHSQGSLVLVLSRDRAVVLVRRIHRTTITQRRDRVPDRHGAE
jgi:hypothetical protein